MRIREALAGYQENMPEWLRNYVPGRKVNIQEILKGRVVYYPGSRDDGEPVHVFNQAKFAHLFVYVDYGLPEHELRSMLTDDAFWGYRILDIRNYSEKDLCPNGWRPHYHPTREETEWVKNWVNDFNAKPFCLLAVLERKSSFGEDHGAERFAILFLMADGIATYDALFANRGRAPDVLVVQDHGFGGNYNYFGREGHLARIARETDTLPDLILCNVIENVWDGYDIYRHVCPDRSEGLKRFLFHRSGSSLYRVA